MCRSADAFNRGTKPWPFFAKIAKDNARSKAPTKADSIDDDIAAAGSEVQEA
ncbi:MAG: hypothetical protein RIM84_05800 [Alphaproteobacteria bacterium]